jgi:hypothetical protein
MEQIISILAWPAVVLIVILFALFLYRPQIALLISRTKKLGKDGFETFETQPTQPIDEKKGVEEFLRSFDNPLVLESEQLINNDLKERRIEDPSDREKVLVRSLAALNIVLHFEAIYDVIWASQVACLRYLNSRELGTDLSEISPFYELAKVEYPLWYENYLFEQWLAFLRAFNLVTEQDSKLFITIRGREFLKFIIATGKSGPHHG